MKRYALILLSVMVATVVAGCGASSPTSTTGNTVQTGSGEKVELVLWDTLLGGADDTPKDQWFITQAIDKFQAENPNITIKRVPQAGDIGTYNTTFRSASIAKNGPDITTNFAGGPVLSFADFLEPLDTYFTEAERAPISGWDVVRTDFKADGKIVAIPYGAGSYFEIFYNKDLMKQAGIDPVVAPKTWEEFLELAQKVKDAGVTPVVIGEQEGYTGAWVMSTLVGGDIGSQGFYDMRAGTKPFTDPSMVKGYEAYQQLFSRGLTNPDAGSKKNGEGQELFLQGKGAMWVQGGWANRDVYAGMKDKVGNFAIPTLAGAPNAGAVAGGPNAALAVTNYSQHKEEAVKFLKFMLRADILDLYVKIGQTEPSNHKDADTSVIENPLLRAQGEWLKAGKTIYPFDNIMSQPVNDVFYRDNASVFTGKSTPQDAVNQIQAAYDQNK